MVRQPVDPEMAVVAHLGDDDYWATSRPNGDAVLPLGVVLIYAARPPVRFGGPPSTWVCLPTSAVVPAPKSVYLVLAQRQRVYKSYR